MLNNANRENQDQNPSIWKYFQRFFSALLVLLLINQYLFTLVTISSSIFSILVLACIFFLACYWMVVKITRPDPGRGGTGNNISTRPPNERVFGRDLLDIQQNISDVRPMPLNEHPEGFYRNKKMNKFYQSK